MKFNQTRLLICLIVLINLATITLFATVKNDSIPKVCPYYGTVISFSIDKCGPCVLLDNGTKIRPNDTLLYDIIGARVNVGYEVIDSSCNGVLAVNFTCFKIVSDSSCHANYTYSRFRCGFPGDSSRCIGNMYGFTNNSHGNIIKSEWDFGDGSYSNETNPVHTFPDSGVFNVCLTITTVSGCKSTFCHLFIFTVPTEDCKAEIEFIRGDSIPILFDYRSDSIQNIILPGFLVIFRDVSNHEVVQRNWDFGDGTTSSDEEVYHFFSQPGKYQVCLTITTAEGCIDTECIEVLIGDSGGCHADFSYFEAGPVLDILIPYGYTYFFYDISIGDVVKRFWVINGDTIPDSPELTYTFPSAGEYTVCLVINTSDGCTSRECKQVIVGQAGCYIDFTWEIAEPDCRGYYPAYLFSPVASAEISDLQWSFGDSTFTNEFFPFHYYKKCGYYTVCLNASLYNSCETSICKTIFVPDFENDSIMRSKCGQVGFNPLAQPGLTEVISVFPNPASDKLNLVLNSNSMQTVNIVLIDVLGQIRSSNNTFELMNGENQIEIDINDLPTGNYYFLISSPETTIHGSLSVVK